MEDYDAIEKLFMEAVEASHKGKVDEALNLFKSCLEHEPRMCEPRFEIASICVSRGAFEEAEAQCREGLKYLERGWRWLDNLTDEQMLAHGYNLLGEILKQRSISDEVLDQGENVIRDLWEEAGLLFDKAADLDPESIEIMENYYGFKKMRRPTARRSSSVAD